MIGPNNRLCVDDSSHDTSWVRRAIGLRLATPPVVSAAVQRLEPRRRERLALDARQQLRQKRQIRDGRPDALDNACSIGRRQIQANEPATISQPTTSDHGTDVLGTPATASATGHDAARSEERLNQPAEANRRRGGPLHRERPSGSLRLPRRARRDPRGSRASSAARRRPPGARAPRRCGARAKPVGERVLAGFGARRVEQLEQRSAAEQIEVACVRVIVEEPRAVAAGAGPAIVRGARGRARRGARPAARARTAAGRARERRPATPNAISAENDHAGESAARTNASHSSSGDGARRGEAGVRQDEDDGGRGRRSVRARARGAVRTQRVGRPLRRASVVRARW